MKYITLLSLLSAAGFAAGAFVPCAAAGSPQKQVVVEEARLKKVAETGTFLGVHMEELDESKLEKHAYPQRTGVLVTEVSKDSPAERAGILKDDIIYRFAGETVRDSRHLANLVRSRTPGDEVEIVIYRGGEEKVLHASLGERETSYVALDLDHSPPYIHLGELGKLGRMIRIGGDGGRWSIVRDRARLGVHLHELDEDLAPYFKAKAGEGMLVLEVLEGSASAAAGVKTGDVIVRIDGDEVSDIDDVFEALDRAGEREVVSLSIVRKGKKMELPVEFGGKDAPLRRPQAEAAEKAFKLHRKRILEADQSYPLEAVEIGKKIERLEREIEDLKRKLEQLERND